MMSPPIVRVRRRPTASVDRARVVSTIQAPAIAAAHTTAIPVAVPGEVRWTPGSARARSTTGLTHRVQAATVSRLP